MKIVSIEDIKRFHELYNRLSLIDHVVLCIMETNRIVTKQDIYNEVFKQYRQVTKGELNKHILKLHKLGLISFNYFLGHYILTKNGIYELSFIKDFVDYKKIEEELYSSSS